MSVQMIDLKIMVNALDLLSHKHSHQNSKSHCVLVINVWPSPLNYVGHVLFFAGMSKSVLLYSIAVQVLFILSPQICHVIYMYRARNNVKDFADEFYVSLSSIVVVFKDFSLMKNFDVVKGMIDTMDMKMMQPKGDMQKRKFHGIMGTWKRIYWTYTTICITFVIMQLASPAIDRLLNGSKLLPLVDCYPFDIYTSPVYEVMYLYQTCVLFCLVLHNYNVDTFITGMLYFASAQCDILCDNLSSIKLKRVERNVEIDKAELTKELTSNIKHHQEIFRFIRQLEQVFSLNIFEQYSCSLITFCTTMFKFSLTEPFTQEFFTIIFYQTSVFLQMFAFCWAGTLLTSKSEKISTAAYQSDWIGASKAYKKNLIIFIKRSYRPLVYRTFIFGLSLDLFVSLLRSSFSYYTVLTALNEK
ncbi:unnamed protein product [Callosobruchus maculatus]|uniref:Odorant receptor n=1 Tax=Callosobruchus maculatus TaxID=64391 RepID=A0A653CKV2_CALMS|nr:unnamed protein product [Callosobruchus maculatus]